MESAYWSRREWLGLGVTGALGLRLGLSDSGREVVARGVGQGFTIGACDWTLGKRSSAAALEVARRIGLDGVMVDVGSPEDGMPLLKPETRAAYKEAAKASGVQIASLALGTLNEFPFKSDPRAEEWVAGSIAACHDLGAPVLLLAFFGNGDLQGDPAGIDASVAKLRRLTPRAEKAGVTLGFESWLCAEKHLELLDRVGSPALKVYYDVANSHKQGYNIYQEIRQLGKRICEFHAKDYSALYGKGSVDFRAVRRAMDDIGYRGWIHMEGTQMPLGIEESCRYDLQYLREIFPREI